MAKLKNKMGLKKHKDQDPMVKIINNKNSERDEKLENLFNEDLLNREESIDVFEKEQQELEERWRRTWEARWNRLLELEEQMENSPVYKNDTQKRMFEQAFEDLVEEEKEYLRYKTLFEQRIEECRKKAEYDQENDFKEIASMLKISGIAYEIKDGAMYIYPSETIGHSISVKDGEVLHTLDEEKPAFFAQKNFAHNLSDGLTAENVALLAVSMKVDSKDYDKVYETTKTIGYVLPKAEEEIQEVSKENIERLGLIPETPETEKIKKFTEELIEGKVKQPEITQSDRDFVNELHGVALALENAKILKDAAERTEGVNSEELKNTVKEADDSLSHEVSPEGIAETKENINNAAEHTLSDIKDKPHKTIGEFISNWYEAVADHYKENKIKREEVKLNRELSKAVKNLTGAEEKFLKECEKIEESLKEQETLERRAKSEEIQGYERQLTSLNTIAKNYEKLNTLDAEEKENVQKLITEELKKHKELEGLKGLEFEEKMVALKEQYQERKSEAVKDHQEICTKYKDLEISLIAKKGMTTNIIEEFKGLEKQTVERFTGQEKKEQIERLNKVSSQLKDVFKISEKSPEGKAYETIEHLKKLREELESQEIDRSR